MQIRDLTMESETLRQRPANTDDEYDHGDHDSPSGTEGDMPDSTGMDGQFTGKKVTNTARQLLMKTLLCILCGVVFGIAIEKGRVFEPRAIRYQMVFNKMIMLKMFLSAVATGMFGLSLLAMIPATSTQFIHSCISYYNSLSDKGVMSSVFGGLILGIGMTLCGSCPTTIYVQMGAKVPNFEYTFAGALIGTLLYGLLKPKLDKYTEPEITESSNPWGKSPYFVMAMPVAVMFGMVVVSFEILYPWTRDVKNPGSFDGITTVMNMKAWPPFITGIIVGLLQIPLVLGLNETMGGSSSFITILAQVLGIGPLRRISPFISKYRCGFHNWWQIFYACGVILGAYISASSSGYIGKSVGVPVTAAFIGGAMIAFGARVAGGCTSGHGLSGMSFLSILSIITVASMFGGAMATAFMMKQFGTLKF